MKIQVWGKKLEYPTGEQRKANPDAAPEHVEYVVHELVTDDDDVAAAFLRGLADRLDTKKGHNHR